MSDSLSHSCPTCEGLGYPKAAVERWEKVEP